MRPTVVSISSALFPVLDFVPEGGRDCLLELLHQVLVALAERSLDRLEVVDVRVTDGLLGDFVVSRASLGDGGRKQRFDLPDLGHRLGRRGGVLFGFVGASAARGHAERKGG